MKLQLRKPIIFFDLETTGLNITADRIVEISIIRLEPNGKETEVTMRINPEMHIPEEATAVHHITDADVASCPTFKQVADQILQLFSGCDIAGFNSNRFDLPMLCQEFNNVGKKLSLGSARMVDVQTIFFKKEPRNLTAAYRFYCGKDLENAHSATADTRATLEVLMAQLERYPDLPTDVEALSSFASNQRNVDLAGRLVYDDQNREIINFGKYKGRVARELLRTTEGLNYLDWILKGDFPQDTKDTFMRLKIEG